MKFMLTVHVMSELSMKAGSRDHDVIGAAKVGTLVMQANHAWLCTVNWTQLVM